MKAHDTSTNEAYRDSLANEDRITNEGVSSMSVLTHKILSGIDYEYCRKKRAENFGELCCHLGAVNKILISSVIKSTEIAPICYPLLIENDGIRRYLVEHKIYVPQWWKSVISNSKSNEHEKFLSQYLLPLPVDQRYSAEDMKYIAGVITDYLKTTL